MKKNWFIFLIIFIFLIGCSKNNVNLEKFINMAREDGYILKEDKTNYETFNYIKNVYYAINRENAYDIQFIELVNNDYAQKFFLVNKNDLSQKVTNNSYVRTKENSNYAIFHVETDEEYLLIIRSNNNIIYINADINYINEIEEFLTDLELDY